MVPAFQALGLAIYALFFFYVFDIRRKDGMEPIVRETWTTVMKLLSIMLLGLYGALLINAQDVCGLDWLSLVPAAVGAGLVAAAKITLGRWHTWVGYHKRDTVIVQHGIYSRIRHPLYTGIFLYEFGVILYLARRATHAQTPSWIVLLVAAAFLYLMTFNITMAMRESREMERKFGDAFREYQSRVRAFIPFNRGASTAPAAVERSAP